MIFCEAPAAWLSASGLARRFRAARSVPVISDAQRADEARRIQARHRNWLVMWSPWRRTFTAFSCFSPTPLMLDRKTSEALVSEMLRVELHYSPTRIDAIPTPIE
jgi:hypothetical protein